MERPRIRVENVRKRFKKNMTSFKSIAGYVLGLPSPDNFWAVDDISFTLNAGESLGIIGANGAGKSTLLKVITKIVSPTSGTVTTEGRIGALIEVGAGFNSELTGHENIFLYGAILGMSKREIRSKIDAIIAFSGLSSLMDTPVKFYSSGMYLRLGFAVTAHMDPDILIIDEAMAVGDVEFQRQCIAKIDEFKKQGKIIIVVSHDMNLIREHTRECIFLSQGKVAYKGETNVTIEKYLESLEA